MNRCRMATVAVIIAVMAFGDSAGAGAFQHWTAISRTAMGITGDVEFSPSEIIFQNKTALRLSRVGEGRGITWLDSASDQPAEIFRIVKPVNVVLLNGNTLCGSAMPTYLTVVRAKPDEVLLTVITGEGAPGAADYKARICAGFTYTD